MTAKRKDKDQTKLAASAETPQPVTVSISGASIPIVGIGASAGGLAAFEAFFSGMPIDTNPDMAFVLVQHLAPDHKSILTDLIRRYTRMQAFEVEDGMRVQPNCAYIIPPNRDMAFINGTLQLLEPAAPRGQRLPIDYFFRSLAQDQHERAIGIILSGTGSDGTLGVRAIKGEGGMVMAQTPESTEYDGMPRSALATGLVDYELPPAEMPAQLIAYAAQAFGKFPRPILNPTPKTENALKKSLVLLRAQTGHDFSQYKLNTVYRRIERRMAVHQIATLDLYARYLQQMPLEIEALFHDLLIGVTRFFRDPEAFQVLEQQVIPQIFADRPSNAPIRVWSVGCSTGEEAYSVAILLVERLEALKQDFQIQVFATDIDNQAIATARTGLYPVSIAADLSPERLARFFTIEPDNSAYRIHKNIREVLVFSEHNVIRDPPFSRLDLIVCRNLLIYLNGDLQKKIIPLFHYALNPNGFLFLGTSETVGEFSDLLLFTTQDRKHRLYQRKEDNLGAMRVSLESLLPQTTPSQRRTNTLIKPIFSSKRSVRELTEQALLDISPEAALVNSHGDILYLHGRTGRYLELTPGEPGINNILKMAREGLQQNLTTALYQAAGIKERVYRPGLQVKSNGGFTIVNLTIQPLPNGNDGTILYLVTLEAVPPVDLESAPPASAPASAPQLTDVDAHTAALRRELLAKDEYIQATREELETTNEELKSANEEMQSVNEELQSTNEELETSKEELQSVNEELSTVNAELQNKVNSLARANNDLSNLLAGTGIGTVFVDLKQHILRFTPSATPMINLILSDVGRPVGHIVANLIGYDRLVTDVQAVLDTLIPRELEVQSIADHWYTLRIQPYRTLENMIEGAVITFVDITAIKKTEAALREAEWKFRALFEKGPVGVAYHEMLYDPSGKPTDYRFLDVNETYRELTGINPLGKTARQAFPGIEHDPFDWIGTFGQVAQTGDPIRFQQCLQHNGRWYDCAAYCYKPDHFVAAFIEITELKQAEIALQKANEQLRLAVMVRDAHDALTSSPA